MTTTTEIQGKHDFDFWMGSWRIENERLKLRLQGCDEWESFEARARAWPLPGGIGNVDEWVPVGWRPGFVGMAIRIFNPGTQRWSIYWLQNENPILESPVVGSFTSGVGIFEGPDVWEGTPILVRFTWSHITANSAHWEQAFSTDEGKTWETNWRMRMTRVPE